MTANSTSQFYALSRFFRFRSGCILFCCRETSMHASQSPDWHHDRMKVMVQTLQEALYLIANGCSR